MDLLDVIAQNARLRRQQLNLSQEEVSGRAGLHRTYVGAIERSERNISVRSLEKLARALETTTAMLVAER